MATKVAEQWDLVLADIKARIPTGSFNTWFISSKLESFSSELIQIGVANLFIKEWLHDHYLSTIKDAISKTLGCSPKIEFKISSKPFLQMRKQQSNTKTTPDDRAHPPVMPTSRHQKARRTVLHPDLTFEKFIVGNCNRISYEASQKSISSPASFNPLVLYGASGTGKTHLLQAIANKISQNDDNQYAIYLTAEQFAKDFMSAIESGQRGEFQKRLRNIDFLLIDDIQYFGLGKKNATQEELIHTIDALNLQGNQFICSSVTDPRQMHTLTDRLQKRLLGGLSLPLEKVDQKSAEAMLTAKCPELKIKLQPEIISLIARDYGSCIRELGGALTRVAAFAGFSKQQVTLPLLRSILGPPDSFANNDNQPPTLQEVIAAISEAFGISTSELQGRKRNQRISQARRIAMVLSRELTGASFAEIGQYYGKRNHATVLSAIKMGRKNISKNVILERRFNQLRQQFKAKTQQKLIP